MFRTQVLGSCEEGNAVLIVADSGGFAEALYWWVTTKLGSNGSRDTPDVESCPFLADYFGNMKPAMREKIVGGLHRIVSLNQASGGRQLSFFSLDAQKTGCTPTDNLATALLFAIAQNTVRAPTHSSPGSHRHAYL
jgi:hypothetical protein